LKRWKSRTLAILLATCVLLGATASPAWAQWYCNGWSISGGYFDLCIEQRDNGYDARVAHYSGSTYTVRFFLDTTGGSWWDNGSFTLPPDGIWRSFFFSVGTYCQAQVQLYYAGGSPAWNVNPLNSPRAVLC
jgi:hypothetical protein